MGVRAALRGKNLVFGKKMDAMELIVKASNEEELRFVQSVLNRMKIKNELHETDVKNVVSRSFLIH